MSIKLFIATVLSSLLLLSACSDRAAIVTENVPGRKQTPEPVERRENPGRVIHVLVALCDNENQGIVPVPAHLGNGENPEGNLYWGARFGIKTHFASSKHWQVLKETADPTPNVLRRIVLKHRLHDIYMVADAYRGDQIKATIDDFFAAVSGNAWEDIELENVPKLQGMSGAEIVAFIGHNGLMDFKLEKTPAAADREEREAIILACASRNYFSKHLKAAGAKPLLWTTNLMAPEAYILHDAIESWAKGEGDERVRRSAAAAYAKYQKISQSAAEGLLVTGW